ncbi:MAG: hypothetical protein KAU62_05275 [Candidatus Heimdallarchaeota archaeon]|nr:hypothetical protein [Candidatus Heimdallarchaeota archaeon]MCG3255477.1 hypothetical protein [Candidatus Heimdallarchaeota archaeon]MCK4610551.1 hypothetical protein [Candidatus Heimdallarchaeota archaeon]
MQSVILTERFHKRNEQSKKLPFARKMMSRSNLKKSQSLIETMGHIADSLEVTIAQIALN